jgi:predicted O-methyltransferase YrrM
MDDLPALVKAALDVADQMRFSQSCMPAVGRLLRVLAAQVTDGVVAEIGSGCGVGAAWITSGLQPAARLITIESDPERAAAVRTLFASQPQVDVVTGDWRSILDHAPFRLIFADATSAKHDASDALIDALAPGGTILLDDLTPEHFWPDEWRGKPDPVRATWLSTPRLLATELLTTPRTSVIVGVRM